MSFLKCNRKEVNVMAKEYICLACGNHFVALPQAEKECSRCGSTNVLKLNPENIFGFLGGG